jgi:hypothetical protein
MNLRLSVDQNFSFPQDVGAIRTSVRPEAVTDSGIEQTQVATPKGPTPDYEYHEVKLDGTLRPTVDGGVIFRALSSWEFCEQVKLDAHKRAAELLATDIEGMQDALKTKLEISNPELARKSFTFSIDETGLIKPIGLAGELTQQEESILYGLINEDKVLGDAAREYIWTLAGIVHRTLEGLDAKWARFFSPASGMPNRVA